MHVETISEDDAQGRVREMYDQDLANDGYISNYTRLFSLNPAAWDGWLALRGSLKRMDLRRYELATIAAAGALRCRYCVAAHGAVLESAFFSRDEVERLVTDYRDAGLSPEEVAIMALAEKVALNAYKVTREDVQSVRDHGLTDAEIFDVVLAAAIRSFFSKTLDAMGAEPDPALSPTIPLFDLLRPIPTI